MNFVFFIIFLTIHYVKLSSILDGLNENNAKVIEITTKKQFDSYMNSNESFIIDIYSPICPHCITFNPHYQKLALIYDDTLPFLKINAKDNKDIYQDYLTVTSYPSVFLYDNGSFYRYYGINEVEFIYEWIENKNGFTCQEILTKNEVINLLSDNVINDQGFKNPFILGVFDKHPNTQELIDIFINLTRENRMYVTQCLYYVYDFDGNDKNAIPLLRHNFIYSYQYQKGINTFSLLDQINLDKELKEAKIEIGKQYELFLLNNWLKLTQEYDDFEMNDIFIWEGIFLIFSYKTIKERVFYEEISRNYITSKDYDKRVRILFVNLNKEYKLNFYLFCKEEGIYLSKSQFDKIKKLDPKIIYDFSYKAISEVLNLEEQSREMLKKKQKEKDKKGQLEISRFMKAKLIKDNNLEAIKLINKKIDHEDSLINNKTNLLSTNNNFLQNNDEKEQALQSTSINIKTEVIKEEHINTQIIIFPFYLIIYSAIFALGYKQYYIFYPAKDEQIKTI